MTRVLERWVAIYKHLLAGQTIAPFAERACIGLVLLTCLIIRLWTIGVPALDRTEWEEINYLAVSNNYRNQGFDLLHPEIGWPAEAPRWTAMELPLVPYLAAVLYRLFGYGPYTARMITLLAFLLMSLYVYRLGKREFTPLVGVLAGLASAIIPLWHPFGRSLFSDPVMIAMSVISVFYFAEWMELRRRRDFVLAWLGLTVAVALKWDAVFLVPLILWIAYRRYGWQLARYKWTVALLMSSLFTVPLAWYAHAYHLERASGIDAFGIFPFLEGHNVFQTGTMLVDGEWYRTMLLRVLGMLGGKIGGVLVLLGLAAALRVRRGGLFFSYLATVLVYFGVLARAQIGEPFRQLAIVPGISVFVALGALAAAAGAILSVESVASRFWPALRPARRQGMIALLCCSILMLMMTARNGGRIFNRDPLKPAHPGEWEFAQEIKKLARPGSKLVVAGEYYISSKDERELSPILYHYTGLQGWTIQSSGWNQSTVDALIQKGASEFAAVRMSREPEAARFLSEMKDHYRILYQNGDSFLLDLKQPLK